MGAEAVRIAELANHPFSLYTAYYGVGVYERERRAPSIRRSVRLSIAWKFVGYGTFLRIFTRVAAALGYAYAVAGRVGEALPLLNLANERAIWRNRR